MRDHTANEQRIVRAVTGCRIYVPDGRVTVEGTDDPDATLDIRDPDHGATRAITDDVVVTQDEDGVLTIRLAEGGPSRARWLRVERRPRPAIHLRSPRTAPVTVETVGAEVRVSGCRGGQEVTTVTGNATIDRAEGRVAVRTVSGSIAISGTSLDVQAATTSGRLSVDAPALDALQLRSVSGRVEVTGRLAAGRDHRIETLSGDVRVTTAGGARIVARTISGRLAAEGAARRESQGGISGLIAGDGSAVAQVTTVSGDIRLASGSTETRDAMPPDAQAPDPMLDALEALARGDISVEEASRRLEVLHG